MKRNLFVLFFTATVLLTGCERQELTVDMGKTVTDTNAPPVNLSAEIARAKGENKLLLLEFGSSDSCPPCVLFQQKVFSSPKFLAYEKSNLDFVRLDYPLKVDLRSDTKATNNILARQFGAVSFPTFIALDHDGKEFWRMPAKDDPNPALDTTLFIPKNFIALLKSLKAKVK